MTAGRTPDGLDDFTGDAAGGELLRRSLRTLAERHAGTPLADRIGAVLAGRAPVRELAEDPAFVSLAREGMGRYAEMWQGLSAEERAALVRQGQAEEAALDAEAGD